MIFTREILEGLDIAGLPTTNDLDLTYECDGKIAKYFYKGIIEHFDRMGMYLYVIFIPTVRVSDHNDWIPLKIEGCTHCGNDMRIDTLSAKEQSEIWIESRNYEHWLPPIISCRELEGNECNKIYCHAIGVKNINEYKNLPISTFEVAKKLFDNELNWVHVKIG